MRTHVRRYVNNVSYISNILDYIKKIVKTSAIQQLWDLYCAKTYPVLIRQI